QDGALPHRIRVTRRAAAENRSHARTAAADRSPAIRATAAGRDSTAARRRCARHAWASGCCRAEPAAAAVKCIGKLALLQAEGSWKTLVWHRRTPKLSTRRQSVQASSAGATTPEALSNSSHPKPFGP